MGGNASRGYLRGTSSLVVLGAAGFAVAMALHVLTVVAYRSAPALALPGQVLLRVSKGAAGSELRLGAEKVLYTSPKALSAALSDLRPVLPGHSLVVPMRYVERLEDLSEEEAVDLFETARSAQQLLRGRYGATAFNWAVKDGAAAGQAMPHLHVHVVPRKANDLPANDLVYELIDLWTPLDGQENVPPPMDLPEDDQRKARTDEDMALEASSYAKLAGDGAGQLPKEAVRFGKFSLKPSQVFFASSSGLSLATVNLKPLVPGHVLVIPRRVVPTIDELTEEEMKDLWRTVRRVQSLVQESHGACCSNLGMQDGKDAGQSVPHVHVHILPRGQK